MLLTKGNVDLSPKKLNREKFKNNKKLLICLNSILDNNIANLLLINYKGPYL